MRRLWAIAALSFALASGCFQSSLTEQTVSASGGGLNSERIQQQFGSYGVELLRQDAELRVSNLFSTNGGQRTCRTLAVVRFASEVPAELAAAHAEIVAGGSIGAVLSRNGWQVVKRRLDLSQIEVMAGSRAAILMQLPGNAVLATDLYELFAQQGKLALSYAVIAEIHHPDYMTLTQLRTLPVLQGARTDGSKMVRLAEQIATEIVGNPNGVR